MRMMSIASGSSGNCIYVGTDNTHILIDAGISRKRIIEGINLAGISAADLSGVFVTHEHSDHIKGINVLAKRDAVPVFGTCGTNKGIQNSCKDVPSDLLNNISADEDIVINDIIVHPFRVSHDANEPVAYTVTDGRHKVGVITDLGFYDDYIVSNLVGCNMLLVEANHDVNLLQVGSYPYYLKQRILGRMGHLSNEVSGQLVNELLNDNIENIMLGHLSKENNYDKLAFETVKLEIDMSENGYKSKDFNITVAKRDMPSTLFNI